MFGPLRYTAICSYDMHVVGIEAAGREIGVEAYNRLAEVRTK